MLACLCRRLYVEFPCSPQETPSNMCDTRKRATLDFQLFFADSVLPPHFHKLSALLFFKRLNDSFCLDSYLLAAQKCVCMFN